MTEPLTLKRLLLWARWVVRWLTEAKLLWIAIGVLGLALMFAFGFTASEPKIRLTGLGLQILGLGTVIWGIRQTGQLFGQPTLFKAFAAWLSRFPSYQPRIVGAVGTATGGATVSARMSVSANAAAGASLEKRIEVLERNVGYVRDEIGNVHKELDQTRNELKQALKNETKERNEADNKLHERLETAQGFYPISTDGWVKSKLFRVSISSLRRFLGL